jgi:hypothetical protein
LVASPKGDAAEHAELVEKCLAGHKKPKRSRGRTASDEELLVTLRAMWKRHQGKRATMLRELRSKLLIACEQSRFKGLMDRLEG